MTLSAIREHLKGDDKKSLGLLSRQNSFKMNFCHLLILEKTTNV